MNLNSIVWDSSSTLSLSQIKSDLLHLDLGDVFTNVNFLLSVSSPNIKIDLDLYSPSTWVFNGSKNATLLWDLVMDRVIGIRYSLFIEDQQIPEIARQSSYSDLYKIFNLMNKNGLKSFYDPGASFGRASILASYCFPDLEIDGVEFDPIRANEGRRCLAPDSKSKLRTEDALNIDSSDYQVIWVYLDTGPLVQKIIFDLLSSDKKHYLVLQESHGSLFNNLLFLKDHYPYFEWDVSVQRHSDKLFVVELDPRPKLSLQLLQQVPNHILGGMEWYYYFSYLSLRRDYAIKFNEYLLPTFMLEIDPYGREQREIKFFPSNYLVVLNLHFEVVSMSDLIHNLILSGAPCQITIIDGQVYESCFIRKRGSTLDRDWVELQNGARIEHQDIFRIYPI